MTVAVTFEAREAAERRRVVDAMRRRRITLTAGFVGVLLVAMIAVPAPLEWRRAELAEQAERLVERVEEAEAVAAEHAELSAERARWSDLESRYARWLAPVPHADVRWLVELLAERCGVALLRVDRIDVAAPSETRAERPTRILGALVTPQADESSDPDVSVSLDDFEDDEDDAEARPLAATRWTIEAHGAWSSIVTLAGLLGATDAPLRLYELSARPDGERFRATIVADRLRVADAEAER